MQGEVMMKKETMFILLFFTITYVSCQYMKCAYGERGSLMSTCINATPEFFRTTTYRFDHLDETVRCINCSLEIIGSNTFDLTGNHIENLDLSASNIIILKEKSFIGLVYLKTLLLQNNKIQTVNADTFQGIKKLRNLNLEHNSIDILVAYGFKELVNLNTLNLGNNLIETIHSKAFDGLSSLQDIDLSKNYIHSLSNIFNGLSNIVFLNLKQNKVKGIKILDLQNISTVIDLNLSENLIESISDDVFLGLGRLQKLDLSRNPIKTLSSRSFRGLDALEEINFENNLIENFPKGMLQGLYSIRVIQFSSNLITTFKTGTYSGLPQLQYLNFSGNKINSIETIGVLALPNLHKLDLSCNNISYLDYEDLIVHAPKIAEIALQNNSLPCELKMEMEEFFKHDNIKFTLTADDTTSKCNSTPTEFRKPNASSLRYIVYNSDHHYATYTLISILIIAVAILFYLQYRVYKEINGIIGRANCSEVRLLPSGDLDIRQQEY